MTFDQYWDTEFAALLPPPGDEIARELGRRIWDRAREVERTRCAVLAGLAASQTWGGPGAACRAIAANIRIDPAKGE